MSKVIKNSNKIFTLSKINSTLKSFVNPFKISTGLDSKKKSTLISNYPVNLDFLGLEKEKKNYNHLSKNQNISNLKKSAKEAILDFKTVSTNLDKTDDVLFDGKPVNFEKDSKREAKEIYKILLSYKNFTWNDMVSFMKILSNNNPETNEYALYQNVKKINCCLFESEKNKIGFTTNELKNISLITKLEVEEIEKSTEYFFSYKKNHKIIVNKVKKGEELPKRFEDLDSDKYSNFSFTNKFSKTRKRIINDSCKIKYSEYLKIKSERYSNRDYYSLPKVKDYRI